MPAFKRRLSVSQILAWADSWRAHTGRWPTVRSGRVGRLVPITWCGVDYALRHGTRGLAGNTSLAALLAEHRVQPHTALLTEAQILQWADTWLKNTGRWPCMTSGSIPGTNGETWGRIHGALIYGRRGLAGGSSLPELLARCRGARNHVSLPPLTHDLILVWADKFFREHGKWPGAKGGVIPGTNGETWTNIDAALRNGSRGLLSGSSLSQLFREKRGHRNISELPRLRAKTILSWADAYWRQHKRWPTFKSGPIPEVPLGETWGAVNRALSAGRRGLPGGDTLAAFLARHRSKRYYPNLWRFSEEDILQWTDAYHERHGRWPGRDSGSISEVGLTWKLVDNCLVYGCRGFPKGGSLAKFLARQRGVRNIHGLPPLTTKQILKWARQHKKRSGHWPTWASGPVHGEDGEIWNNINAALLNGGRGLPGGLSIRRLIHEPPSAADHRGRRLTVTRVQEWIREHHRQTGAWPNHESGQVRGAASEDWQATEHALYFGFRGLPGGMTILGLVKHLRSVSAAHRKSMLTTKQILRWADDWHAEHGCWPSAISGDIAGTEEAWVRIDAALRYGHRGLPGGLSLCRLLGEQRGKRNINQAPALTERQVKGWIDEHVKQTGEWPKRTDGEIPKANGETWGMVDNALRRGTRGLKGGITLYQYLRQNGFPTGRHPQPRNTTGE